ncbi:acetate--CoA ligase family protein [Thermogladius sp. 4427co]|uniref:acetate--CoA ligase family protein n=1 Tax=Thermogladius sp. 4427co TaxID=3450718 RepID=UPI003F7A8614
MLDVFFNPSSIAVVGATPKEGKVGRVILENLKSKYKGMIYPVNPHYQEILGLKTYSNLQEIPGRVDLAVIATPARTVPQIIEDAGLKGVRGVIIISGGFRETGTQEGLALEEEVKKLASRYGIRIIGPNCLGVLDNWSGVDTFFLPEDKMKRPPKGNVSIISQSGAFASALLDWMSIHGYGVSKVVSFGNKVDVDEVELLEYLSTDPTTNVVFVYLEGVREGRGRDFVRIAKRVSEVKPVVVYKAGKTSRGGVAASSHTAALAGNYEVYKSVFRQTGIIEAESFDEIMDLVKVLSTQPLLKGRRVYIITDAGGVGVMLTDAIELNGLEVPETPPDLKEKLKRILPPHCILGNPIDLTGDADDERFIKVLEEVLPRSDVDAVVIVALPQIPGLRGELFEYIAKARKYGKPVLVVIIGGEIASKYKKMLEEQGVPVFESPERLAKALRALYIYSLIRFQRGH